MPHIMLGLFEALIIKASMPMNEINNAYERVKVCAVGVSKLLSEALEVGENQNAAGDHVKLMGAMAV